MTQIMLHYHTHNTHMHTHTCTHTHTHTHTPQDSVPNDSLKFFHGHSDPTMKKGGYTIVSITPTLMNITFYSHKGRSSLSL